MQVVPWMNTSRESGEIRGIGVLIRENSERSGERGNKSGGQWKISGERGRAVEMVLCTKPDETNDR